MGNMETKLYSYKMMRATGFAPNPYFGVLTLAACKSGLRRAAQPGDWIAGWTAKGLKECPTDTGDERLVYLARVTRKLTPTMATTSTNLSPIGLTTRNSRTPSDNTNAAKTKTTSKKPKT